MTNDSSTGGFVIPNNPPALLADGALDNFFQQMIVGLTNLPGNLVRPRWQPKAPIKPDINTDWVAIGIYDQRSDNFAFTQHHKDLPGPVTSGEVLERQEEIDLLCSVYGPNAYATSALIRDGLGIAQNREALQLNGMGLINVGNIKNLSENINDLWYRRLDLMIFIRRVIVRTYPILDVASSFGSATDGIKIANYKTKTV